MRSRPPRPACSRSPTVVVQQGRPRDGAARRRCVTWKFETHVPVLMLVAARAEGWAISSRPMRAHHPRRHPRPPGGAGTAQVLSLAQSRLHAHHPELDALAEAGRGPVRRLQRGGEPHHWISRRQPLTHLGSVPGETLRAERPDLVTHDRGVHVRHRAHRWTAMNMMVCIVIAASRLRIGVLRFALPRRRPPSIRRTTRPAGVRNPDLVGVRDQ